MALQESQLDIVIKAKDEASKAFQKLEKELSNLKGAANDVGKASGQLGGFFDDMTKSVFKGVAAYDIFKKSLGLVVQGFQVAISEAGEAQQVQAQLAAVIQSTGGVAGVTAEAALQLADSLQSVTTFTDDAIASAETMLLTFTNIGKDIFPETTKAVLDLSVGMKQDLQTSAIQVGKALQDPVLGVVALRKAGVSFTDQQQEVIKSLVETGKAAEAQALILKELNTEFGGRAEAEANTFAGRLTQMKNQLLEVAESVGNALLPSLEVLVKAFGSLINFVTQFGGSFGGLSRIIYNFTNIMVGLVKSFGLVGQAILGGVKAIYILGEAIGALVVSQLKVLKDFAQGFSELMKGNPKEALDSFKKIGTDITSVWEVTFKDIKKQTLDWWDDTKTIAKGVGDSFKEAYSNDNFKMPTINAPTITGFGNGADNFSKGAEKAVGQVKTAYQDLGISASRSLIELRVAHEENLKKTTDKLQDLSVQYEETRLKGVKAVADLNEETKTNLAEIDKSINGVVKQMTSLRNEFNQSRGDDVKSLAETFVGAETKIKDLKNQLTKATDVNQIFDLQGQIKEQESALSKTKDVQIQYADAIEEARRRAGLSDIERAIEDFTQKRALAEEEFNAKMADLETEKRALVDKRALESAHAAAKLAELTTERDTKLANITQEKTEVQKQQKEEIELYAAQLKAIDELITQAQQYRAKVSVDASKQSQEAVKQEIDLYKKLEEQIKSTASAKAISLLPSNITAFTGFSTTPSTRVRDAVISPDGKVVSTDPQDYIIATKNPAGLATSTGIVINIQGGMYLSEEAAEKMGDMILDKIKSNIRI